MKIVVISASPRKTANTQIIMKYVNEYTKSKNPDTKFINLSNGEIECWGDSFFGQTGVILRSILANSNK